jgi:hypothetical protein
MSLEQKIQKTSEVMNTIQIGIANSSEEKESIYHFRFQTYVEEMSKNPKDIDYNNKLLYDDLDDQAILLYATSNSTMIGTARINIGKLINFSDNLINCLALDEFPNDCSPVGEHQFALLTKLMVAPAYRSTPALYLLIAKCYEICSLNQVQYGFGACNFHLLRLYEQMGFRRYKSNFTDPGYGLLSPIVMLADDVQHFKAVRSPLFRMARKKSNLNIASVEWFHEKYVKPGTIINSQLITEEKLWSIICAHLPNSPTETFTLLKGLSEEEAKTFLHSCSSYIHCETGELITPQGDVSYSHNLLLSGKLKSSTLQRPAKEYARPGQHFGANGLTEHTKHTEDIIVTSPAEILVLSGMAFQRFFHSYPEIAHKIVYNTTRLARERLHSLRSKSSHL